MAEILERVLRDPLFWIAAVLLLFMAGHAVGRILGAERLITIVAFPTPFAFVHFGHGHLGSSLFLLQGIFMTIHALISFFHVGLS